MFGEGWGPEREGAGDRNCADSGARGAGGRDPELNTGGGGGGDGARDPDQDRMPLYAVRVPTVQTRHRAAAALT